MTTVIAVLVMYILGTLPAYVAAERGDKPVEWWTVWGWPVLSALCFAFQVWATITERLPRVFR